ncbi:hypothetical protein LINGRAHAP2_LOCUS12619 [Linum grandiflorum]
MSSMCLQMVQQMMENKEFPVKKEALRDVQNQTRCQSFITRSPVSKKSGKTMDDAVKVTGIKRPSPDQSPSGNAANAQQLVYVRRKSEAEMGKAMNQQRHSHFWLSSEDMKATRFSAFAPVRMGSKPNDAHSAPRYPFAANGTKRVHWEERYRQLQVLLKKQDESDHDDYIQMLRSVTSVERSRHAVALEKRLIQLSFEEAKEIQWVAYLNVLGRNLRPPPFSVQQQLPPKK